VRGLLHLGNEGPEQVYPCLAALPFGHWRAGHAVELRHKRRDKWIIGSVCFPGPRGESVTLSVRAR